jgi:hypothetical protein
MLTVCIRIIVPLVSTHHSSTFVALVSGARGDKLKGRAFKNVAFVIKYVVGILI